MKFAFYMPHLIHIKGRNQPWELDVTGADQTRLARLADQWGYDMLSVPEHMFMPNRHLAQSGAHHFHAAAGQGYFAGVTERIKVNSSIAILPLQHPIVTAKALSTIDWMSSGRIIATFGVGWLKDEFDVLGVPFHERGKIADEYLAAIIACWTQESPEFDGKYVSFKDIAFEPKCATKPHLPVWIAGDADPVLRRTAKFASGWWPFLTKPADIPARIDYIKSQPDWPGGELEVFYSMSQGNLGEAHVVIDNPDTRGGQPLQKIVDRLNWFAELGVTMSSVPIPPVNDLSAATDYAQWVIEEVKPRIA